MQNKPIIHNGKSCGFTLTEMAVVLAVGAALIGGIWGVAATVRSQSTVADAIAELQTIKQNILDRGQPFLAAGDVTAQLVTAGVIPQDYIRTNNTVRTPWATDVTITAVTTRQFRITFSNVRNTGPCEKLVLSGIACEASSVGGVVTANAGCPVGVRINNTLILPSAAPEGWTYYKPTNLANCRGNPQERYTIAFDYAL